MKMSVEFKDVGLRLGVLEALLDEGHFDEEREALGQELQDVDAADAYSTAISNRLKTWELRAPQLAEVTEVDIDGGNEVYLFHALYPDEGWAGCDRDEFVVNSLEDLRHLPNLASLSIVALLSRDLDLEPLLSVPALNKVFLDLHEPDARQRAVLTALKTRGVEVGPAHLVP
jgi:hypothetical protein